MAICFDSESPKYNSENKKKLKNLILIAAIQYEILLDRRGGKTETVQKIYSSRHFPLPLSPNGQSSQF
jgi:hypothetical protein